MIQQDWLNKYQYISGTELTLNRLAARVRNNGYVLAGGIEELKSSYQELDWSFQTFFPELIDYVRLQHKFCKN